MPAFTYCSKCGSPLAADRQAPLAAQKCFCCGATHYHNSKPTAGALIVNEDQVLLSKRARAPFRGFWDIPGGFLEAGEDPREGARREVREETGLEVVLAGPAEVYVGRYGADGDYTLNLYYRATIVSGEPNPADDVTDLRWFAMDSLPENLAFDHERDLLRRLAEELRA
ncbi:MAG TPA: NUDIX hydrolase [Chloroflexota bacterium]|nr:NUDIX hydrolase [Chloroflexota bacterium]